MTRDFFNNSTADKSDISYIKELIDFKLSNFILPASQIRGTIDKDRLPIKFNNFYVQKITGLNVPVKSSEAVNLNYVDSILKAVTLDGSKIVSGTIDKDRLPNVMNYFSVPRISGLHEPVTDSDAVNREYVNKKAEGMINKDRLPNVLNDFTVSRITVLQEPANRTDIVTKAYVDNLERKFHTMISNYVLFDIIEINIRTLKKGMNMIDYVDKVITGVHTKPAERGSILTVLSIDLIIADGTKQKMEWMKKLIVVNGYIGLDLSNESSDNDSDILFFINFKLRFWILRTKESLSKRLSGKATAIRDGSGSEQIKITATAANNPTTDAVQQFKNLLDNK
jgi:hypothetical protein